MADILTNFYDDGYEMRFLNLKKPFFTDFSVPTADNVVYISGTHSGSKWDKGLDLKKNIFNIFSDMKYSKEL